MYGGYFVVILHLSDSHFNDKHQISSKQIAAINNTLNQMGTFSTLIICFTGDIAYSGAAGEYKIAREFLAKLRSDILSLRPFLGYIPIYTVPGNHDLRYGDKASRTINDILADVKSRKISNAQKAIEDIDLLSDFFSFSKKDLCFAYNPCINIRMMWLNAPQYVEQRKVQINLINSALLSTLRDNDKGYHYLPEFCFKDLAETTADFTITMSHHSPEWFCSTSKERLEECLLATTNLYLYGHDHSEKGHNVGHAEQGGYIISSGGALSNKNEYISSSFTAIKIDFSTSEVKSYQFTWKNDSQFYNQSGTFASSFRRKITDINHIEMDRTHFFSLLADPRNDSYDNILEYFTFPILSQENSDPHVVNKSVNNIEDFLKQLEEHKFLIIEGKENSGKSTLARLLQYYIYENGKGTPVLLDRETMYGSKYQNFIKRAFIDQYGGDPAALNKYNQLPLEKKIMIIDEPECIKQKEAQRLLFTILREKCGRIIILTNKVENADIRGKAEQYVADEDSKINFHLEPFYSRKRCELITKLLGLFPQNTNATAAQIENQMNIVNNAFRSQIKLMDLTPDFIVQYVRYWQTLDQRDNNKTILTEVFETNINYSLLTVFSPIDLAPVLMVLENLAHYIHFNRTYPLTYSQYESLVKEYCDKTGKDYNTLDLLDKLKKAKILLNGSVGVESRVRFVNRKYLAFFVARGIKRKAGRTNVEDEIAYLLKYISFGINGDILLFLSHIDMSPKFILGISRELRLLVEAWDEYSIEKGNIDYLNNYYDMKNLSAPTQQEKSSIDEYKDHTEKALSENDEIELINQYDYDEVEANKDENKVNKAIALCKLISQILPQFEYMLDIDEKKDIIDLLYSVPNKVAFFLLKQIDNGFLEIVDDIVMRNSDNPKVNREYVGRILQDISFATILSLYDYFMSTATRENTKELILTPIPHISKSHQIQRLIGLEVGGYISEFVGLAVELSKEKEAALANMLIRCVRACLIRHQNIDLVNQEKLLGQFFPKSRKSILFEKEMRQMTEKAKSLA